MTLTRNKLFAFSIENSLKHGCFIRRRVFNISKVLGSGASATVLRGTTKCLPKQDFAIKLFNKANDFEEEQINKEIAILKELNHPNISKLKMVIASRTRDGKNLIQGVAFENCDIGDLFEYMSFSTGVKMSNKFIRAIFQQLARGVAYLHANRIVHNDIKPENVLFKSNGLVVLSDFGLSEVVEIIKADSESSISSVSTASILSNSRQRKRRAKSVSFSDAVDFSIIDPRFSKSKSMPSLMISSTAGTDVYNAPEKFLTKGSLYDGAAADMWSLGVVLHQMLFGELPAISNESSISGIQIERANLSDSFDLTFSSFSQMLFMGNKNTTREQESPEAISISQVLLKEDPCDRYTAIDLVKHSWVKASALGGLQIISKELKKLQWYRR